MKIGILNGIRNHPGHSYDIQRVYADYIEDSMLAEEMGFDFAWFGEHHSTPDDWTPAPLLPMTYLAAKTRRIRLGTSIICLPFHHPLRVAEDVAVLDILSGGRIDLGIGVGSQLEEFEMFGIDPKERVARTWESIDLIRRCFTDDWGFEHHGKFYNTGPVKLNARPVQKNMPTWLGGLGPRNIQRAAERGMHLMAGGSKELSDMYDQAIVAAGRNPADLFQGPLTMVSIAPTEDRAFAKAADGFCYFMNFYTQRRQIPGHEMPTFNVVPEMLRGLVNDPRNPFPMVVGTPERATEKLLAIRNGACGRVTHLPLAFRHAGMDTAAARESMELFKAHVMPKLVV
jgi:alkanesulfonate monooxygenase SsuD/methylene tetrahydromethanopterin reductase-like flavin-dependent oxidoreductase (luciferase family)